MATRHPCSVCHSRKVAEAYPMGDSGIRLTATCRECLEQVMGSTEARDEHGVEEPDQNSGEEVQDAGTHNTQDTVVQPHDPKQPGTESTTAVKPSHKRKRRNATGWPTPKRRKQAPATPKPPPPQSATCRICVEEKDLTEFIKKARSRKTSTAIPYSCLSHLCYKARGNQAGGPVCKSCIGLSLTAGLDTVGADNLGCLEPNCGTGPWSYDYLSQYMLPGALENYHEQMFQTFMVNASTFQCLNSECGAVGLLEKTAPGFPNVVCSACKQRHCALCTVTWHEDMSCQAYRAKNHKELVSSEEKAALRMLAKLGAKRCPRCQLAVDKDGGCNSMYCTHCRRYFDWTTAEPVVGVSSKQVKPLNQPPGWFGYEQCEADVLAQTPEVGALHQMQNAGLL